jgi:Ni/Fe-hydrogenase subunit HybB-like protein
MVIFESMMSHRVFAYQVGKDSHGQLNSITIGLGKAAAAVLFAYFCFKWLSVAHGNSWHYLNTGMGYWFLLEVFGFVAAPCAMLFIGVRKENVTLIRVAAIMTVIGIILNRVNVAMVAMNWQSPDRYIPSWMEIWITMTVITLGVLTFRFLVKHTPILYRHPDFINEPEH